jgi:hypothetical protein
MRVPEIIPAFFGLRPPPRERRPRGWLLLMLIGGTFLVFSQIGFLSSLAQSQTLTVTGTCLSASLGGIYAVGYMLSGVFRQWWGMVPIAIFQFFFASRVYNWLTQQEYVGIITGDAARDARSATMWIAIVCLAVGFAMMMRAVIRVGRLAAKDQAELAVAQRVHQQLVPPIGVVIDDVAIDGVSMPSSAMGGDLIEVMPGGGDRAGHTWTDVIIADISGHGVGPGLIMGMLKSCVRTRAAVKSSTSNDLASVADDVRKTLEGLLEPGRFATMAWVRLHHDDAHSTPARDALRMEVVMAGHPPVLVMRQGGTLEKFESEQAPIGAGMDETLTVRSSTLQRGDVLLMTTDGLAETFNKAGKILGFDAVEQDFVHVASTTFLEKTPPPGTAKTPAEMNPQQRAAMIREWMLGVAAEHGKQTDDRSVLVVTRGESR